MMSALTSIFWFVLLLLIIKVYATWATPLPVESEVNDKSVKQKLNDSSRLSNYFLHEPYGPNTYAFGYEIEDPITQNVQFRDERRYGNGSIEGSFGYVRPDNLIEITHYRAGDQTGYMAQRQSFKAGDNPPLASKWPTQRPDIILDRNRPNEGSSINVTWDPNSHLNLSVNAVADNVEQQLKQQHGLDLNHINVAKDILQPAVLDVINGKAPLHTNATTGGMSFKTVHDFIPNGFPIVPFELPSLMPESSKLEDKYQKSKLNNAEKAPQVEPTQATTIVPTSTAATITELPLPKPLVNDESYQSPTSWYHKIIEANRREFLQHLPNLNQAPTV